MTANQNRDTHRTIDLAAEMRRVKENAKRPHFLFCDFSGTRSIHVWDDAYAGFSRDKVAWPAFDRAVQVFRESGFLVMRDRDVKKRHRSLQDFHRRAARGRLRAHVRRGGRHLEIKLYSDPNPTHAYPEYGSHVEDRLPYLDRVRLRLVMCRLREAFAALGYADATGPDLVDPYQLIEWSARDEWRWVNGDTSIFDRPGYNAARTDYDRRYNYSDRSKLQLVDGEWRLFYDYRGRLRRGQVFHNINNMWWVAAGGERRNIAAHDILASGTRSAPRFDPKRRRDKLEQQLKDRIAALDLERAIPVRDLLRAEAA